MGDIGVWLGNASVVGALAIVGLIIFAESGLLIGVLLPGDTLLFTAGFFAAQGKLPLIGVMVVIFVAAVLGDNLGYFFGGKSGPRVFRNKESIVFRQEYLERARQFYARHGGKTVMFARFFPYARTFAPVVAGVASMRRLKFIIYNLLGALLWTVLFVLFGYWLGIELAQRVEQFALPVFVIALVIAFSPTILYFVKNPAVRHLVMQKIKRALHLERKSPRQ